MKQTPKLFSSRAGQGTTRLRNGHGNEAVKAQRLTRKRNLKKVGRQAPDQTVYEYQKDSKEIKDSWPLGELLSDIRRNDYDTEKHLPCAFTGDRDVLRWCVSVASDSPTALALMKEAAAENWSVALSDLSSGGFHIDAQANKCQIDHHALTPSAIGRSDYFRNAVLLTFIRVLRDIWHENHVEAFEKQYGPEAILMLERIRAADGDTVAVYTAWELRGAGFSDVWRHLIGSEEGDMAMTFSRFLERDPSSFFDGSAMAYAFRQWYADETRVDACDHDTLEFLDSVLEQSEGRNPFGSSRLMAEVAEKISALPDGTVYLQGKGETILTDPFFSGLNDPINQSHLLHLMYDLEVIMVNNVPFRDSKLARMIFPQGEMTRTTVR